MTQAHFIVGDTRDVTATIPDGRIDLVLTSPPFLALRSYLPADHPDKAREIGSEATPAKFLDVLLGLTAEWGRVLAPHGSIAVELGDTYSSSGGAGGDYATNGLRENQPTFKQGRTGRSEEWPLAKSLALIPELYRIALAYGINPLTGQPSPAGRWRVRNVVRWHRPNPPVGALGDKYRPATTDMVIATRAKDRWFDLDAVRHPHKFPEDDRSQRASVKTPDRSDRLGAVLSNGGHPAGAPPLDTWTIPTHPYKGAHYATWPPALCEIPIKSMCPLEVCIGCGTPRRRIVEVTGYVDNAGRPAAMNMRRERLGDPAARQFTPAGQDNTAHRTVETLGWTECDCPTPEYRPGIVLDPFAGTGTTLAVATGHGRNALGIDLNPRNLHLANDRIGPLILTNGPHLPDWLTP